MKHTNYGDIALNEFTTQLMNSMKLVIPLHSLYWSIHTKDESILLCLYQHKPINLCNFIELRGILHGSGIVHASSRLADPYLDSMLWLLVKPALTPKWHNRRTISWYVAPPRKQQIETKSAGSPMVTHHVMSETGKILVLWVSFILHIWTFLTSKWNKSILNK